MFLIHKKCLLYLLLGLLTLPVSEEHGQMIKVKTKSKDDSNSIAEETDESYETFKPTNEWQTVKKGQPIPQGLHVRMNLQTGKTEAKLMDEGTSETDTAVSEVSSDEPIHDFHRSESLVDGIDVFSTDDGTSTVFSGDKYNREQLQDALKNMVGDDVEVATDEDVDRVKQSFRSYDELKKELKDINMAVKTDVELLSKLVQEYKAGSDEEKISVLMDLEYLVHQFDNAQDFIKLGGFTDIVFPGMNSSVANIRSECVHLLGSAVQSNPRVQIAALETGAVQQLLRVLAFDSDIFVRGRALYALSCLARHFPSAQRKLIEEGGLSVFGELFEKDEQPYKKLQVKVITLLNDLVLEKKHTEESLGKMKDSTQVEKLRQYIVINLEKQLVELGWCSRFTKLLFVPKSDRQDKRDDLS